MKKINKRDRNLLEKVLRYAVLLILGLFMAFSSYFYAFLLPLTIYPVNFLLSFFYESLVSSPFLLIDSIAIEIIPACVAVSAYFLLLILNLTTQMKAKQRFYSLFFSILALLLLNILRISALSIMLINNYTNFEMIHSIFWYSLSILFVVGIWFLSVWLFKIKSIPAYTDIKPLIKQIGKNKR